MATTQKSIDDLFVSNGSGPKCWRATKVTPEAEAFLSELEGRMNDLGRKPNWRLVAERLESEFGLKMTPFTVARHYKGECACP